MRVNSVVVCFFIISSAFNIMHCMEYVNHELQDCFTHKVVLDYDGNADNARYIAQTAKMVHSDIRGKELDDISAMREKYAHVKNLIFTKPQSKVYDVITIYTSNLLCKEIMLDRLAIDVKGYLKEDGEIHALVTTQSNCLSIENSVMLEFYPRIYECFSLEMKQQLGEKRQPCGVVEGFKSACSTDDEIKDDIWKAGYKILSYKEIEYEDIMKIGEIKKILKSDFFKLIEECEFLKETAKLLWKEFIALILNKYKKNGNGDVIVPVKATKIHLRNKGPMRLRLNVNFFGGFTQKASITN